MKCCRHRPDGDGGSEAGDLHGPDEEALTAEVELRVAIDLLLSQGDNKVEWSKLPKARLTDDSVETLITCFNRIEAEGALTEDMQIAREGAQSYPARRDQG